MKWGKTIGKWPILVGNCPGFVGNRLIGQYSGMATKVLDMGATPAKVDGAIEGFGNKMGPFRMADMVGLDLGIQVHEYVPVRKWSGTTHVRTHVRMVFVPVTQIISSTYPRHGI